MIMTRFQTGALLEEFHMQKSKKKKLKFDLFLKKTADEYF